MQAAPHRILVAGAQVPFVRGGAEWHMEALVRSLRERGFEADSVSLPFQWDPREAALRSALAWRLVDVERAGGRPVDLLIATRFPTYAARHPLKVLWLFHPFRQAYDLHDAGIDGFSDTPEGRELREHVVALDTRALKECRRLYTTSRTNADRLRRYNGLEAEVLRLPLLDVGLYRSEAPERFVLSVGRLDRLKRTELFVRAAARLPAGARAVVVGDGPDRAVLEALAAAPDLAGRVEFLGRVDDARLRDLYARAGAVFYAPHDEDYGLVTLEAMQSRRPVVTTRDAGGPLEFVAHGETGLVTDSDPAAIGAALASLIEDPAAARRLGEAGFESVRGLSWDTVIEALTQDLR
jgi:glycosyltransferase involved in cell wall biosynthesis